MNNWQAFYLGFGFATLVITYIVVRTMKWRRSPDYEREERS